MDVECEPNVLDKFVVYKDMYKETSSQSLLDTEIGKRTRLVSYLES